MAINRKPDEQVIIGGDTTQALASFRGLVSKSKVLLLGLVAAAAAAFGAVAAAAVSAFREQEKAEISLRRALAAQGQYTAAYEQRLLSLADKIQDITGIADQEILGLMTSLIQIGRITEAEMERALIGTIGLAKQTGREMGGLAETVGEALQKMALEGSADLGEIEERMTATVLRNIENLKEQGRVTDAQALIVEDLHTNYARFADRVEGSTDVYADVAVAWGEVTEEVGRLIHNYTGPLANWVYTLLMITCSSGLRLMAITAPVHPIALAAAGIRAGRSGAASP